MNILIIRNYPSRMDVKHNSYNIQEVGLAKALVRRGHTCDIVFWSETPETVKLSFDDGKEITVYYRTGRNILKNALFHELDDLIEQYDVIQPCEYNQMQAWKLAKKYPEKTVIYHGPYYSPFNRGYNKICWAFDRLFLGTYKKLHTPFLVKSRLAEQFLGNKGLTNVTTVGVGIDLGALDARGEESPACVQEIPHGDGVINLLYIGRFEERRNIPFLYDVAKLLGERGVAYRLITVGTGDEAYKEMCAAYAAEAGVEAQIIHIEKLEQKYLAALYRKCDVFLLPTHYEIFGMVLLEAMYYGLTCLTTANGGSDMLIRDRENGRVLPLSAELWCDAVIDSRGDTSVGEAAHRTIAETYTWDALAEQFEAAYLRRISERKTK